VPVEDRGAQKGDYAVIGFVGRRDGEPIEGAQARAHAAGHRQRERLIPGFEDQLLGHARGRRAHLQLTFPDDYPSRSWPASRPSSRSSCSSCARSACPRPTTTSPSRWAYADLAALRAEIGRRLERNSLDRARHGFADRIIEFAVANASVELPDLLVEREIEVMLDELRVRLAEQGIGSTTTCAPPSATRPSCGASSGPTPSGGSRRCSSCPRSPTARRSRSTTPTLEAELARSRERYAANPKLLAYLESPRGRAYTRSLLRRSRRSRQLIDAGSSNIPSSRTCNICTTTHRPSKPRKEP
jgi:trigger factor